MAGEQQNPGGGTSTTGGGGGQQPKAQTPVHRGPHVHVTLEVCAEKSRNVAFNPTREVLRGRWQRLNLVGVSTMKALQDMPEVPGLFIEIDTERRAARIYDPLAEKENATLMQSVRAAYKQFPGERDKTITPWETRLYDKLSDDEIKTWLYWLRRMVTDKAGVVVKGTLPEMDDILGRPGRTRIEQWNQSTRTKRYLEETMSRD